VAPNNGNGASTPTAGREIGTTFAGWGMGGGMGPWMYGIGGPYSIGGPFGVGRDEPPLIIRPWEMRLALRRDGTMRQCFEALTQALRAARWQITDGYQASWVRQWLADLDPPVDRLIAQIATACAYHRALFEEVFAVNAAGQTVPARVAFRPTDNTRLTHDDQGRPTGLVQNVAGTGDVPIPLQRSLIYLHNEHYAPGEGAGDMDAAYACYWEKRAIRQLWRIFQRRAAQPWTIATAANDTPESMKSLATRVATVQSGGVVGVGQGEVVNTLDVARGAGQTFLDAMNWLDQEMTGSILAQFLNLGQAKVGSFALSRDHSDFFTLGRDATLVDIGGAITEQLIHRAILANWPSAPKDNLPAFRFEPLAEADVNSLVTLLGQVMAAPQVNPAIPQAFVNELIKQVALAIGMDVDQVTAGLAAHDPQVTAAVAQAVPLLNAALPAAPAQTAPAAP